MPIYEYRCQSCDTCFEKLLFCGDKVAVVCPQCNGDKVTKQISCTSFMKSDGIGKCAGNSPKEFS